MKVGLDEARAVGIRVLNLLVLQVLRDYILIEECGISYIQSLEGTYILQVFLALVNESVVCEKKIVVIWGYEYPLRGL